MPNASLPEPGGGRPASRGLLDRWRWLLVAAYMAGIFGVSSLSRVTLPGQVSDKSLHALAYAGLSAVMVWALVRGDWRRVTWRTVLTVSLVCAAYGLSDEVHQLFVPNRQYDLKDLAADTVGAVGSASALWAWGIISRGSGQSDGV